MNTITNVDERRRVRDLTHLLGVSLQAERNPAIQALLSTENWNDQTMTEVLRYCTARPQWGSIAVLPTLEANFPQPPEPILPSSLSIEIADEVGQDYAGQEAPITWHKEPKTNALKATVSLRCRDSGLLVPAVNVQLHYRLVYGDGAHEAITHPGILSLLSAESELEIRAGCGVAVIIYRFEKVANNWEPRPFAMEISGSFVLNGQTYSVASARTIAAKVMAKDTKSKKRSADKLGAGQPKSVNVKPSVSHKRQTVNAPSAPVSTPASTVTAVVDWQAPMNASEGGSLPRHLSLANVALVQGHFSDVDEITLESMENTNLPLDRASNRILGCPCLLEGNSLNFMWSNEDGITFTTAMCSTTMVDFDGVYGHHETGVIVLSPDDHKYAISVVNDPHYKFDLSISPIDVVQKLVFKAHERLRERSRMATGEDNVDDPFLDEFLKFWHWRSE